MKRPTLRALAKSRVLHVVRVDYGHYRACGAECARLRVELEMIRDAAADAIRDNEHVGFTVRTLHVLRTIKL